MLQAGRRLGAVAVLAGGAVHLQQYIVQNVWFYPAIGALFLLNVIGSGVVGLALLAPLERMLSDRLANAAMIVLTSNTQIWIAAGMTDLRRGFMGLSALVQNKLEQSPMSGHVFVFRGRRGDLIKLLWFDGDGLCSPSAENPQYHL